MAVQLYGISGRPIQNSGSSIPVKKKNGGGSPSTTAAITSGGETVSVSSTAAQLQAMEASIADMPIADMSLVESIQLALATGDYHVNGEASADGLLEMERKLP
ncbi:MAG: flagellar biosynthesis anti-sigma factor FlgM [Candidatus Polarisedimenticolaceae bacterium]|nr:flagellar biosynthesis anti-sigma factor FlgM [Candidatus Polarisedimenticolaceae bacterium]